MIDEMASDIESHGLFDVVLSDSVVNSVDTATAEADVMTCLNAFCRPGGRVYFSGRARARIDGSLRSTMQADQRRLLEFLDEDGFTAIYREGNWFYQKYHDEAEARALAARFIGPITRYEGSSNSWRVSAVKAIDLAPEDYRESIAREFDLMWPAGRRVGRADRMLAAWEIARQR